MRFWFIDPVTDIIERFLSWLGSRIFTFGNVSRDTSLIIRQSELMREVSLETLPNVNIRDPSHDKNHPIMSVTGSINQNVFKYFIVAALGEITYSAFTSFRVYLQGRNWF